MLFGPLLLFAMTTTGFVGPDRAILPPLLPWAATALDWTWLGYALLSERRVGSHETVPEPRPARVR